MEQKKKTNKLISWINWLKIIGKIVKKENVKGNEEKKIKNEKNFEKFKNLIKKI